MKIYIELIFKSIMADEPESPKRLRPTKAPSNPRKSVVADNLDKKKESHKAPVLAKKYEDSKKDLNIVKVPSSSNSKIPNINSVVDSKKSKSSKKLENPIITPMQTINESRGENSIITNQSPSVINNSNQNINLISPVLSKTNILNQNTLNNIPTFPTYNNTMYSYNPISQINHISMHPINPIQTISHPQIIPTQRPQQIIPIQNNFIPPQPQKNEREPIKPTVTFSIGTNLKADSNKSNKVVSTNKLASSYPTASFGSNAVTQEKKKEISKKNLKSIFTQDELTEVNKLIIEEQNDEIKEAFTKLQVCEKEQESPLIKKIKHEVLKHKESNFNLFFMLIHYLKENYNFKKYHFLELFIYFYDFVENSEIKRDNFIDAFITLMNTIRFEEKKNILQTEKKVIKDIFKTLDSKGIKKINLDVLNDFLKELCKDGLDLNAENIFTFIDKDEKELIERSDLENFLTSFFDFIENSEVDDDSEINISALEDVDTICDYFFIKNKTISKKEFCQKMSKVKGIFSIRQLLITTEEVIRKLISEMIEGGMEEDQSILKASKYLRSNYKDDNNDELDSHKILFGIDKNKVVNESILNESVGKLPSEILNNKEAFGFGISLKPANNDYDTDNEDENYDENDSEVDNSVKNEDSQNSNKKFYEDEEEQEENEDESKVVSVKEEQNEDGYTTENCDEDSEKPLAIGLINLKPTVYSPSKDDSDIKNKSEDKKLSITFNDSIAKNRKNSQDDSQDKILQMKIAKKESQINLNQTMSSEQSSEEMEENEENSPKENTNNLEKKSTKSSKKLIQFINQTDNEDSNKNLINIQPNNKLNSKRTEEIILLDNEENPYNLVINTPENTGGVQTPTLARINNDISFNKNNLLPLEKSHFSYYQQVVSNVPYSVKKKPSFKPSSGSHVNSFQNGSPSLQPVGLNRDQTFCNYVPNNNFLIINNNNFGLIYDNLDDKFDVSIGEENELKKFLQFKLDTCIYSIPYESFLKSINDNCLFKRKAEVSYDEAFEIIMKIIIEHTGYINIKQREVSLINMLNYLFASINNKFKESIKLNAYYLLGVLLFLTKENATEKVFLLRDIHEINKKPNLICFMNGFISVVFEKKILPNWITIENIIENMIYSFENQNEFNSHLTEETYATEIFIWIISNIDEAESYLNFRKSLTETKTLNKFNKILIRNSYSSNLYDSPSKANCFNTEDLNNLNNNVKNDYYSTLDEIMTYVEQMVKERKRSILENITIDDFVQSIEENSVLGLMNKSQLYLCFESLIKKLQNELGFDITNKEKNEIIWKMFENVKENKNEIYSIAQIVGSCFYIFKGNKDAFILSISSVLEHFDDFISNQKEKDFNEVNKLALYHFFNGFFRNILQNIIDENDITQIINNITDDIMNSYITQEDKQTCKTKQDYFFLLIKAFIDKI